MRDLILKMAISIDGFVSDQGGVNRWMFGADQEAKAWGVETIWNAGLQIMGSRSFLAMAPYWQTSTDQFAPPMNQIPKAVFSRQGPEILRNVTTTAALDAARANARTGQPAALQPGAGSWAEAYVATGDLAEEIAKLKAQDGKSIIAHGGVSFARSLVAQGLVDQFALIVAPVALGRGLPLFSELAAPTQLKLMSSKAFVSDANRLKTLENENAKLQKLLADEMPGGLGTSRASVKNGRARRQARSRYASAGRDRAIRASSLFRRRCRSQHDALPVVSTAGDRNARPSTLPCQ